MRKWFGMTLNWTQYVECVIWWLYWSWHEEQYSAISDIVPRLQVIHWHRVSEMDKHRLQSWWDFTIHQSLHQTTFCKWALELKSKSAFGWHDSHISPGRLLVRISPEIAQKRSVFAKQHFYDFFGFTNNQIQRVPHPLSINPSTTKHSLMYQMYECCPKKA